MRTAPPPAATGAKVGRLLEMVRREQQLVAEGRLEELVAALAERQELMSALPPRQRLSDAEREQLATVKREGEQTLVCLRAIREELAGKLASQAHHRRAAGGYDRASRL